MALRWIGVRFRRYCIKRRFLFGVLVTSISFIGCLLLFSSSDSGGFPTVSNTACDYPCASRLQSELNNNTVKSKTEATGFASTERTFIRERKTENDSSTSGILNVHFWSEICGTKVDILRNWPHFPYFPDKRSSISEFKYTQNPATNNNGQRIFGFVHPQKSGDYKFAITSDDTSELWLSPNEDPASSEMIARVYSPTKSAWTVDGDYMKYAEQISKEITLHAGKKYYIESLLKQGSGSAHVAVYWSYRNHSPFKIISSKYLSSFSKINDDAPPHAGKQRNILLQLKRNLFYFNRLPIVNRKEYADLMTTCPYSPTFLVRKKLKKYESIWFTKESQVFPRDDTEVTNTVKKNEWTRANTAADKGTVEAVVDKFMKFLPSGKYFLRKIHKVAQKSDSNVGDRYLLNLVLGLTDTNQSFRLSEHVYHEKGNDALCLPEGINWNNSAKVYFILPVKDQGNWVHHFINQLTDASLVTNDTNFHVIIIDFESKDIDMAKAFNTTLLSSRHTIISLTGKFYKTLALTRAAASVPNAHDIIFLYDLHIDVPADILDSVRMNTIAGRIAYFPIVGSLNCDSSSEDHRGYLEYDGYGIASMCKSDWERLGGMNIKDYKYDWGGEDLDLADRVLMLPLEVERVRHPGLYHHYHAK